MAVEARALRPWFRRMGRWVWLPAMACAVAGVFGLADLWEVKWLGKLLLVFPHIAGVALAAWAGFRHPWAGMVALCGSGLMAGLSWWDAIERQTDGFEWKFNNAVAVATCCGANWLLLLSVACAAATIVLTAKQSAVERLADSRPPTDQSP